MNKTTRDQFSVPDTGVRLSLCQDTAELIARREDVSPQTAIEWLKSEHENNRSPSNSRVRGYANDMRNGRWHMNGEAIKIDRQGRVIDGGHRLRAVILSGATVPMLIVYNAEHEGIDRGRGRSATDARRMRGERVPHIYISSLKVLARLHGWKRGEQITDDDTYVLEESLPRECEWLRKNCGGRGATASVFGAIAFTVPAIPLEATAFLSQFRSLENLMPGSAVLMFHRQLRGMDTAGQANSERIILLTLQALRAHVECRVGSYLKGSDQAIEYWRKRLAKAAT